MSTMSAIRFCYLNLQLFLLHATCNDNILLYRVVICCFLFENPFCLFASFPPDNFFRLMEAACLRLRRRLKAKRHTWVYIDSKKYKATMLHITLGNLGSCVNVLFSDFLKHVIWKALMKSHHTHHPPHIPTAHLDDRWQSQQQHKEGGKALALVPRHGHGIDI
jgi:hypothetical protein